MFQFGNISRTIEKKRRDLLTTLFHYGDQILTGNTNTIPSPISSKHIFFNSL